jgi:hypothetical protein
MGSKNRLKRILAREQVSFLLRSRKHWAGHLNLAREYIGTALKNADPARVVLILGAGWGLEVPWHHAPIGTFGWDADPLSRIGTFLRHRRWAPWVYSDITGAFEALDRVSRRVQVPEGMWVLRPAPAAAKRLAGLLPSIIPSQKVLSEWIEEYRPATIICANVLGQIKAMAYRIVELAFKPRNPWEVDQDMIDPLQVALDAWVAKTVRGILTVLRRSNSKLYLLHDRGVIHQDTDLGLGEWKDSWLEQMKTSEQSLDVSDPLVGVDVLEEFMDIPCQSKKRWIWPVAADQIHVIEALTFDVTALSNTKLPSTG